MTKNPYTYLSALFQQNVYLLHIKNPFFSNCNTLIIWFDYTMILKIYVLTSQWVKTDHAHALFLHVLQLKKIKYKQDSYSCEGFVHKKDW